MSRHQLLLASAGTGKTFRLTHHLIGLLAQGADPGRVLASTFTRKAAGEILDRVLKRLVEGATDPKKLDDLNTHLQGVELDRTRCTQLLASLVRQLDRFQVRTLDAFFVHLGHLFAHDLGLPPGWTIADDHQTQRLEEEALWRLIDGSEPTDLLELLRRIPREEAAKRSVLWALKGAIGNTRDAFLDAQEGAFERINVPPGLADETFETLVGTVEGLELPTTKSGTPVKHWQNSRDQMLAALLRRDWPAFLGVGLVGKVAKGETEFARHAIEDEVREMIELLRKQAAHDQLAHLAERNKATKELLVRFQDCLDEVKRERGQLAFEDLPRALAPEGARGPRALIDRELDLDYRLDARIDHLLLDEFQDTAPIQWRLLERLAEEVLSEQTGERSFFCVGDVKQSIYGWRSAEPRLLAGLGEWYDGSLSIESLSDNYRSSSVVLDTVNQVFEDVANTPSLGGDNNQPYREAAWAWQQGFDRHQAKLDLPGSVQLLEAPEPVEDQWDPVLRLTVERVEALQQEAPAATIGVLLRSNRPIPWILERLLARGLRASGEGGNPLTDSRAVLHFLSALHLADHPGDSAAHFHVQHSPLWATLESLEEPGDAASTSSILRKRLAWENLGEFTARFLPAVDGSNEYGDWDKRRFRQLIDLAYAHGANGLRVGSFVELVRELKVEDPSASGIKVMTIHASKGLEFDAVLLPELNENLRPRGAGVLTHRPDPRDRFEWCSVAPGGKVARLDDELRERYDEFKQRSMNEALCVLYVAMTRARHKLEMIARGGGRDDLNFAKLLRERLGASDTPDENRVIWSHERSQADWYQAESGDSEAPRSAKPRLALAPSTELRRLRSTSPSAQEGSHVFPAHVLLRSDESEGRTYGSLLHRWMEEVEWLEQFDATDKQLLAIGQSIEPDAGKRKNALTAFRRALDRGSVREVLSEPVGADLFSTPHVWREREFSIAVNDCLWSGVFDRVVLHEEGGAPVRAEIIDFKTDAVEGEALERRIEHYRPQLEAYRTALSKMTGVPEANVHARLLFLHGGEVVDV